MERNNTKNDGNDSGLARTARNARTALFAGALVAAAGCGTAGIVPSAGALMLALGLMLGLGGCMRSHGAGDRTDADEDGHVAEVDCDDTDPGVHPGAEEMCCDEVDSNCDGDDNPAEVACNCFFEVDNDGDGYTNVEDCNDFDPSIHPGAWDEGGGCEPAGDGIDNDCDGEIDEDIATCNPIPDADGDGYDSSEDCDDTDPAVNPGAEEACCDGVDSDCDGMDDPAGVECNCFPDDMDRDGYPAAEDCDDGDPAVHPGADEYCCDGVDSNCDGMDDPEGALCNCVPDADGDGFFLGEDCNDSDPNVHPGAEELCCDEVDSNCDGEDNPDDVICNCFAG